MEDPPSRQVYTWRQSDKALADIKAARRVLFKVHGSAEAEESMVLTMNEYKEIQKHTAYGRVMSHLVIEHTLLFVGYGMSDPYDLDIILAQTVSDLHSAATHHFALLPRLPDRQADVDRKARLAHET